MTDCKHQVDRVTAAPIATMSDARSLLLHPRLAQPAVLVGSVRWSRVRCVAEVLGGDVEEQSDVGVVERVVDHPTALAVAYNAGGAE